MSRIYPSGNPHQGYNMSPGGFSHYFHPYSSPTQQHLSYVLTEQPKRSPDAYSIPQMHTTNGQNQLLVSSRAAQQKLVILPGYEEVQSDVVRAGGGTLSPHIFISLVRYMMGCKRDRERDVKDLNGSGAPDAHAKEGSAAAAIGFLPRDLEDWLASRESTGPSSPQVSHLDGRLDNQARMEWAMEIVKRLSTSASTGDTFAAAALQRVLTDALQGENWDNKGADVTRIVGGLQEHSLEAVWGLQVQDLTSVLEESCESSPEVGHIRFRSGLQQKYSVLEDSSPANRTTLQGLQASSRKGPASVEDLQDKGDTSTYDVGGYGSYSNSSVLSPYYQPARTLETEFSPPRDTLTSNMYSHGSAMPPDASKTPYSDRGGKVEGLQDSCIMHNDDTDGARTNPTPSHGMMSDMDRTYTYSVSDSANHGWGGDYHVNASSSPVSGLQQRTSIDWGMHASPPVKGLQTSFTSPSISLQQSGVQSPGAHEEQHRRANDTLPFNGSVRHDSNDNSYHNHVGVYASQYTYPSSYRSDATSLHSSMTGTSSIAKGAGFDYSNRSPDHHQSMPAQFSEQSMSAQFSEHAFREHLQRDYMREGTPTANVSNLQLHTPASAGPAQRSKTSPMGMQRSVLDSRAGEDNLQRSVLSSPIGGLQTSLVSGEVSFGADNSNGRVDTTVDRGFAHSHERRDLLAVPLYSPPKVFADDAAKLNSLLSPVASTSTHSADVMLPVSGLRQSMSVYTSQHHLSFTSDQAVKPAPVEAPSSDIGYLTEQDQIQRKISLQHSTLGSPVEKALPSSVAAKDADAKPETGEGVSLTITGFGWRPVNGKGEKTVQSADAEPGVDGLQDSGIAGARKKTELSLGQLGSPFQQRYLSNFIVPEEDGQSGHLSSPDSSIADSPTRDAESDKWDKWECEAVPSAMVEKLWILRWDSLSIMVLRYQRYRGAMQEKRPAGSGGAPAACRSLISVLSPTTTVSSSSSSHSHVSSRQLDSSYLSTHQHTMQPSLTRSMSAPINAASALYQSHSALIRSNAISNSTPASPSTPNNFRSSFSYSSPLAHSQQPYAQTSSTQSFHHSSQSLPRPSYSSNEHSLYRSLVTPTASSYTDTRASLHSSITRANTGTGRTENSWETNDSAALGVSGGTSRFGRLSREPSLKHGFTPR